MKPFETRIEIRWSDADPNRHVRHSAYYDYGAHARIRFFKEYGFSAKELAKLDLGPIIFKEECSFIRELHPDNVITVNMLKGDVSQDGSRWTLHHEILNEEGVKCAQISTQGAWMDLNKRKLTLPPQEIARAVHDLPSGKFYVYSKSKK